MGIAIDAENLTKTYPIGDRQTIALDCVDLQIDEGDFVAVVGRSVSGKTTLLHMLAGADRPTTGTVLVNSTDIGDLPESRLTAWRERNIGVVGQSFQLLPTLTVLDNIILPMDFVDILSPRQRRARARQLLDHVGIYDQSDKLPGMLSCGQQQRAAIARSLANDPPLILADEPTSNLDIKSAEEIVDLFTDLNYDGKTVVLVSHECGLRAILKREITLMNGRIIGDERLVPVRL